MDMRKLMHQLEVMFRPCLWLRNERTDKDFDRWLWAALDDAPCFTLRLDSLGGEVYRVEIKGLDLWVKNAPYADISYREEREDRYASRATALRVRRLIAPLLAEHRRFKPPKEES